MTSSDDGSRDDPPPGRQEPRTEPEQPLDEDAAWREIVANYGERPVLGGGTDRSTPETSDLSPFDRSYLDALEGSREPAQDVSRRHDTRGDASEPHDPTDHFVPPEPPPLPRGTPARRLAWAALLLPPVVLLLAVLVQWTLPMWLSFFLVAGFVGGFVFLVVTMPRDDGDGSGDGAVV